MPGPRLSSPHRLQAKYPRLVPVPGPLRASWLNQIEIKPQQASSSHAMDPHFGRPKLPLSGNNFPATGLEMGCNCLRALMFMVRRHHSPSQTYVRLDIRWCFSTPFSWARSTAFPFLISSSLTPIGCSTTTYIVMGETRCASGMTQSRIYFIGAADVG